MAALAANAVKSQRRKAAKALADQAMSQVNEQKQFLNSVAQKHRDSLSSISTLGSNKPEVKITWSAIEKGFWLKLKTTTQY